MEIKTGICWWNTRLVPHRGKKNEPKHIEYIAQMFEHLSVKNIDLFCLGEVNADTMDALSRLSKDRRYVYEERTNKSQKNKFSMGIIYNKDRLEVERPVYGMQKIGQRTRKVYQYIRVNILDRLFLHVFMVHWPSRMHAHSGDREKIAVFLRSEIDRVNKSGEEKVVVLGDFNDEPYDLSVSEMLLATRDLALAQRDARLLYNPFWKSLTSSERYAKNTSASDLTGSYFYKKDQIHKWRVFDQAMFSSSLLGKSNWHLDELRTGIISLPQLLNIGPNGSDYIDHLPIVAALEGDIDLG